MTPQDYRKAWRHLMLVDHGFLRVLFQNKHEIAPGVWRSNQPSPRQLKAWRDKGIVSIVNLRGPNPHAYALEKQACEDLGLKLINFRVWSRDTPSKETIRGAKELFETVEKPFVMHCKSGADRTGLMGTLYKILAENRPVEDAMEQLSLKYLHMRQGKTGIIDYTFQRYLEDTAKTPLSFLDWVEKVYDPAAVKRDFMASWWGTLLTDKIFRRE